MLAVWVATHFQIEPADPQKKKRRGQSRDSQENVRSSVPPTPFASILEGLPGKASKPGKSWREQVQSAVVESAWETLCGSILQEVRQACIASTDFSLTSISTFCTLSRKLVGSISDSAKSVRLTSFSQMKKATCLGATGLKTRKAISFL